MPKRPMKANKGQQSPKLQISFFIITIQCKIINKCQYDTREMCFLKIRNFHFHYINFLKLHFVEFVKFSKHINEIMVLVASFVSILDGKSANSSTSFHQWKYY